LVEWGRSGKEMEKKDFEFYGAFFSKEEITI